MHFQAVIKPGMDGWFVAEVPSLPGCISQGKTEEETLRNIREAIELYLEPDDEEHILSKINSAEISKKEFLELI